MADAPTVRLRPTDSHSHLIKSVPPSTGQVVGLDGALADLDRVAQRWVVPSRYLSEGYRWDPADMRDREWWPQGVTTWCDAGADAKTGRRVVIVTWYAKARGDEPSQGSRISLVDVTDPVRVRYRHVGLVEPRADDRADAVRLEPVRAHVGGVVWLDRSLLVADTRGGLRVFDLDALLSIEHGVDGASAYALPQTRAYRAENDEGAEPFRFSFVSVDRTGAEPALVVGEYGTGDRSKRLIRLRLRSGDTSQPLELTDGAAVPVGVEHGVGHTQGALVVGDRRYAAVSRGRFRRGSIWTWGADEAPHEHRGGLAIGPEDLSYCRDRDQVWNVSEHPRRRYVYAVRRAAFDR